MNDIQLQPMQVSQQPINVLFHGNTHGGWFSAYLVYTYLNKLFPVRLFPISPVNTKTWPSVSKLYGSHIILTNVSIPPENRQEWINNGVLTITCYDHHHSAIPHWAPGTINTSQSSLLQIWIKYFPMIPVPLWISSIDRIDRWDNPTHEDRCLREYLNQIVHYPLEKKTGKAIRETDKFIMNYTNPIEYTKIIQQGNEMLMKKDTAIINVLQAGNGQFILFNEEHVQKWNIPSSWIGLTAFIIDTTGITIDSTETSHVFFQYYPSTHIFINYRKKTMRGPDYKDKNIIVYSARSQGIDMVSDGTIFKGSPTSCGATIIIEDYPVIPFYISS
jgi:hypothetical protein